MQESDSEVVETEGEESSASDEYLHGPFERQFVRLQSIFQQYRMHDIVALIEPFSFQISRVSSFYDVWIILDRSSV